MVVLAHGRRWTYRRRSLLASLLVLLVVVPVGVLFLGYWRELSAQASAATHERHGVEYLVALSQLTVTLTDAQSAAVRGEPVPAEALTTAVDAMAAVDEDLGDMHRVSERWSQLRGTAEALATAEHASAPEAYAAYTEASDLLLDLHDKLRETSGLIRDAEPDTYYLQDGAGEELPEAIVAAGRLVDLVTIATGGNASEQATAAAEVPVARAAVLGPAEDLGNDVQAALESTVSRTLSSNVLTELDRFLKGKDDLLAAVPPDGDLSAVDPGQLAGLRVTLQAAATDLLMALLAEMDALLVTRIDDLEQRQWAAAAMAAAAVLLVAAALAVSLAGRSRPAGREAGEEGTETGAAPVSGYGEARAGEPDPVGGAGSRAGRPELVGSERFDAR